MPDISIALKTIIEPEPHQIGGKTVIRGGRGEVAIVQVEINPFRLRRPMLREA